jgi:actin beta/gamma 1
MDSSILVIDNGSGSTKAGVAGEHMPKSVFPSLVGRLKYKSSGLPNDCSTFIGEEALSKKGICTLKYPINNGIVSNWEDMEDLWRHTFTNELRVSPEDHSVILTEPPLNPKQNKQRMAESMFETFNVEGVYIGIQAVLCLYSSALTSGLVTDIGDGVSHMVPIFEGFSLNHAIQRLNLAGRDVTRKLSQLLFESGSRLVSSAEFEVCRMVKENCCYVASDFENEMKKSSHQVAVNYELPDGNYLQVDCSRFIAPEILFRPGLVGIDLPSVHEAAFSAVCGCDIDVRKFMVENLVLSGGTTLIPGFENRFRNEIQSKLTGNSKVRVYAPVERKFSVWIGGSVLGSLDSFKTILLTREEYFESGVEEIHMKF